MLSSASLGGADQRAGRVHQPRVDRHRHREALRGGVVVAEPQPVDQADVGEVPVETQLCGCVVGVAGQPARADHEEDQHEDGGRREEHEGSTRQPAHPRARRGGLLGGSVIDPSPCGGTRRSSFQYDAAGIRLTSQRSAYFSAISTDS